MTNFDFIYIGGIVGAVIATVLILCFRCPAQKLGKTEEKEKQL